MNLILIFLASLSSSSYALERYVSTSGKCSVETTPDRASIVFTVEKVDKDVKVAIKQSTELYEKLLSELKKTKVKNLELSTSEYNVSEKTDYAEKKVLHLGFAARLGVKAKTNDVSDIGVLIQTASNLGVTETNQFVTYLSDEKELSEKKKCLDEAAKKAKEKAQYLAQSLGMKLGKPYSIQEKDGGSYMPMTKMAYEIPAPAMAMDAAGAAAPTIESQKQTISQEVEVSFSLE